MEEAVVYGLVTEQQSGKKWEGWKRHEKTQRERERAGKRVTERQKGREKERHGKKEWEGGKRDERMEERGKDK